MPPTSKVPIGHFTSHTGRRLLVIEQWVLRNADFQAHRHSGARPALSGTPRSTISATWKRMARTCARSEARSRACAVNRDRAQLHWRGARRGLAVLLLCGLFSAAATAQIYKYTDADGVVHYSSTPQNQPAGSEAIRFPCYASDPGCSGRLDWEQVPLETRAFPGNPRSGRPVRGG